MHFPFFWLSIVSTTKLTEGCWWESCDGRISCPFVKNFMLSRQNCCVQHCPLPWYIPRKEEGNQHEFAHGFSLPVGGALCGAVDVVWDMDGNEGNWVSSSICFTCRAGAAWYVVVPVQWSGLLYPASLIVLLMASSVAWILLVLTWCPHPNLPSCTC